MKLHKRWLKRPCHTGKSITHKAVQASIQALFGPSLCLLEHAFVEIDRIADCTIMSHKLVFEIQCSPLSTEEAMRRTEAYERIGYRVVWLLHDLVYNKFRISKLERALFT